MTINLATGRLEPVSDSYTHLDEWNPWLSPIKIDRKFKGYLGDSPTSGPPNKIRFRNLKSTTDNHNHSHWKSSEKWKCSSEIIYKWVKQCHLHHPQSSLSLFTIPKWVMTLFYPHDTCGKVSSATFTENITDICRDCHCGVPSWIWPGNGKSPIYYMMFPYYMI